MNHICNEIYFNSRYNELLQEAIIKDTIDKVKGTMSKLRPGNAKQTAKDILKKISTKHEQRIIAKRLKKIKNNEKSIEQYVDIKKLKNVVDKSIKSQNSKINNFKNPTNKKQSANTFKSIVKNTIEDVEYKKTELFKIKGKNIPDAILTTFIVVVVNTIMISLFIAVIVAYFSVMLPPAALNYFLPAMQALGLALGAIFVAPITEEMAKKISIEKKQGGEFLLIFNIVEFTQYASIFLGAFLGGVIGPGAFLAGIVIRFMVVIFHYALARNTEIGIQTGDKLEARNAFFMSVIIHGMYNFFVNVPLLKETINILLRAHP